MQKIIKRIALALTLAFVVCGLSVFMAACGDNKGDDQTTEKTYTVKVVYSDGTAVDGVANGLEIQICSASYTSSGEKKTGSCFADKYEVNAQGIATVKYEQVAANQFYHVQLNRNNSEAKDLYDIETTYVGADNTEIPEVLTITLNVTSL
jgi:hypothetical protein